MRAAAAVLLVVALVAVAGEDVQVTPRAFATWQVFEADKLAAIWLIRKYINPVAAILVCPRGEAVDTAVMFDTPESQFKRTFNKTTFQALREHFRVKDPKLDNISRIVHDIEINTWGQKAYAATPAVNRRVLEIIEHAGSDTASMRMGCQLFDSLYDALPDTLAPGR